MVESSSQEDQQVADIGFHLKVIEPFSISLHSLGLLRSGVLSYYPSCHFGQTKKGRAGWAGLYWLWLGGRMMSQQLINGRGKAIISRPLRGAGLLCSGSSLSSG